jgi:hypothetical protein
MLLALAYLALAAAGVQSPASPSPSPEPSPESTVEALYRSILPLGAGEADTQATSAAPADQEMATSAARDDGTGNGVRLGRVRLTPAFDALYVRAEGAFLSTAQPVEDRYYEMRPQLGAEMPVSTGFLRGSYQARIRRGSSFDFVESTITHVADVSLNVPLAIGEITAAEHFAQGLLEITEVDPGREYFFRLGRFTRHRHSLGLRLVPGGRADIALGGSLDTVRVDDQAAFFDHQAQEVLAQIGYEATPALRASLGYARIPFTIERPQAESHGHSVSGELRGEILPLTTGHVSVGYTDETYPHAGPGGTRYTGLIAAGSLQKSFTPSSSLTLAGSRATNASNFEENGFYVANSVELRLGAGLPYSLAMQAGAGYHRNDYRMVASSIGAPRRDTIRGWSLGVGRQLTRHVFVRGDYRRERRDSNIDGFDSRFNALTLQLGLGLFAAPPQ